jgi:ABC-type amino acid transport substrate-binding protein
MSWVPQFKNRIVFSDHPLFAVHADVFTRPGSPALRYGSIVGIVNGYEYPKAIGDLTRRGVSFMRNIDEAASLRMLARGRLDAAVVMTSEFEKMPRRLAVTGVTDKVAFAWRGGVVQSYIGFNPAHPRGAEARAAFNRGYAIIRANHVRDRIRDDWMKTAGR